MILDFVFEIWCLMYYIDVCVSFFLIYDYVKYTWNYILIKTIYCLPFQILFKYRVIRFIFSLFMLKRRWISTYINTKMSVCLSVHVFLGHFETDWETLWHIIAFCSWECSKKIIFLKYYFLKSYCPFSIFL